MWTQRVAVAVGGMGVDANLRMVQVIGSPKGSSLSSLSSPLAPASRPGVSEASNRFRRVVRTRRTSLVRRPVQGRVVAVQGQHLQQSSSSSVV
ncbi:hypothetical protein Taro_045713 [Colocasia esculenta]|uniref:Uncharacterized protein n=1 Tax=Colocasia esculenta TaxID=4460 RepID=A0A843X577_COLES|nr:hypothetical protein [Colocasia esculenta]